MFNTNSFTQNLFQVFLYLFVFLSSPISCPPSIHSPLILLSPPTSFPLSQTFSTPALQDWFENCCQSVLEEIMRFPHKLIVTKSQSVAYRRAHPSKKSIKRHIFSSSHLAASREDDIEQLRIWADAIFSSFETNARMSSPLPSFLCSWLTLQPSCPLRCGSSSSTLIPPQKRPQQTLILLIQLGASLALSRSRFSLTPSLPHPLSLTHCHSYSIRLTSSSILILSYGVLTVFIRTLLVFINKPRYNKSGGAFPPSRRVPHLISSVHASKHANQNMVIVSSLFEQLMSPEANMNTRPEYLHLLLRVGVLIARWWPYMHDLSKASRLISLKEAFVCSLRPCLALINR